MFNYNYSQDNSVRQYDLLVFYKGTEKKKRYPKRNKR